MEVSGSDSRNTCPLIGIVILNWNSYADTMTCLQSLKEISYANYETIVVDNGSVDGSGERIAEDFEWCRVVFNDKNLGFAGGVNVGIDKALSLGVDYVLLMQNDMTVNENFLTTLVDTAEKYEETLVGGLIYYGDGNDIWSAGGRIIPWKASVAQRTEPVSENPYETGFLTGALLLVPREFIERYGGLNEDYFYMHEDVELSTRARRNGWKLILDPDAKVYHEVSSSAGRRSPFSYYHNTRNRLRFAVDELSSRQRRAFFVFFIISRMVLFLQWTLQKDFERTKAVLLAVYDHIKDHPLRRPSHFGIGAE